MVFWVIIYIYFQWISGPMTYISVSSQRSIEMRSQNLFFYVLYLVTIIVYFILFVNPGKVLKVKWCKKTERCHKISLILQSCEHTVESIAELNITFFQRWKRKSKLCLYNLKVRRILFKFLSKNSQRSKASNFEQSLRNGFNISYHVLCLWILINPGPGRK